MKLINLAVREIKNQIYRNLHWFLLGAIINGLVMDIYLKRMLEYYNGLTMSYADCFILVTAPRYFVIITIPFFLLLIGCLCKHDFNENQIIRYKTFSCFWRKQVLVMSIYVLIISVFLLLLTMSVGKWNSNGIINFDQIHSLFSFYNSGNTVKNPSIWIVMGSYFLFCVLSLELYGIIYLLLSWLVHWKFVCFLVVYLLIFIDSHGFSISSNFFKISIEYTNWYPENTFHFGAAGILILLVGVLGNCISKRKEILK